MELPTVYHPTDRSNLTEVTIGDIRIWFSYETPIAFMAPGWSRVVRENIWSTTTGKHLNYVDGGDKVGRVSGETFIMMLNEALSGRVPAESLL